MVVDGDGDPVGRGSRVPEGLPVMESVEAAKASGERDIRSATITVDRGGVNVPEVEPADVTPGEVAGDRADHARSAS